MKTISVSDEIIQEGINIVDGVYFPLDGFMDENNLNSVLCDMRLRNGAIWSMPIVLDVNEKTFKNIKNEKTILIKDVKNKPVLQISNLSVFPFRKKFFVQKLFGTTNKNHPGIIRVKKMGDYLIGGKVKLIKNKREPNKNYYPPEKVKEIFKKNGWKFIAAFQTRNPPHRSHEYLQKTALKEVDGLFIQPIIGKKKPGDFRNKHILETYKILIENYYPPKKVILRTFHTFMRYAGPKEAIFHALVRKNFGCTHMIIGRDHAGVGNYYGTYDAQKIFDQFNEKELGIKILKYENAIFCQGCQDVVFEGQCKHDLSQKIHLSGTQLREKLTKKEKIDERFMRKEIATYLNKNSKKLFKIN